MLSIEIVQQVPLKVDIELLKKHLQDAFLEFAPVSLKDADIELISISKKEIANYNKEFRNKDTATDVLSFPTAFNEKGERIWDKSIKAHLGSILICPEVAKSQVGKFGDDYEEEVIELAIHGLRHLLGHDHDDEGNWLPS